MGKLSELASVLQESSIVVDQEVLFSTPVEEMTEEAVLAAWSFIDRIEKELFKKRKAELRTALMEFAEEGGSKDAKGSFIYPIGDGEAKKEHRSGKISFVMEEVEKLIERWGDDSRFESLIKYVPKVDESVFKFLVEAGLLSKRDIARITDVGKPTYALKVKKPSAVKRLPIKKGN